MWLDRESVVWKEPKETGVNEVKLDAMETEEQPDHRVHRNSITVSWPHPFSAQVLLVPRETRDLLVLKELKATLVPQVLLVHVDPLVLLVITECE